MLMNVALSLFILFSFAFSPPLPSSNTHETQLFFSPFFLFFFVGVCSTNEKALFVFFLFPFLLSPFLSLSLSLTPTHWVTTPKRLDQLSGFF